MNTIDVALICKALGDSTRLQIIQMLSDGEKCGCKLLEAFEITQPTLSHHMKILNECGLVNYLKDYLTTKKKEGAVSNDLGFYSKPDSGNEVDEYTNWKSIRESGS